MSATGKTTNYNLPIYQPNDTTSYLVDFNGAMTAIDEVMKTSHETAETANTKADNLNNTLESLNNTVVQVQSDLINVRNTATANTQSLQLLQTHTNEQDVLISKNASDIVGLDGKIENVKNDLESLPYSNTYMNFINIPVESINLGNFSQGSFVGNYISECYDLNGSTYGKKSLFLEFKGTKTDGQSTDLNITIPKEYRPYFERNCSIIANCNIKKSSGDTITSVINNSIACAVPHPDSGNKTMTVTIKSEWSQYENITISLEITASGYDV